MLVSKNNIKIILLLIFLLVIYQITKTSPKNYFAYSLVAVGFYLVYTEFETKQENFDNAFTKSDMVEYIPPKEMEPAMETEINYDKDELMREYEELKKTKEAELLSIKRDEIKDYQNEISCDCEKAITQAVAPLQEEINKLKNINEEEDIHTTKMKTMKMLLENLTEKGVLNQEDTKNLLAKLKSDILTIDEVIERLEKMKLLSTNIQPIKSKKPDNKWWNDMDKSELPEEMHHPLVSAKDLEFKNEYSILNTEKWTVPMPRPPVCIDSHPKDIMPVGTSGYPINLKNFDDSRYVSTSAKTEKQKKELEKKLNE